MPFVRWVHLVGTILFLGGGLAATLVNRLAYDRSSDGNVLDKAALQLARFADAGAALVFLSGFGAYFYVGYPLASLKKQLWLVVMVVFGLVAAAMNGISRRKTRLLVEQPPADAEAARRVRDAIAILRLVFLIAAFGALSAGVWRFTL